MRPILYTFPILGGIKVFGYGLMLFLAFLGALNLATWRCRREKLNPEVMGDVALWVFLGGLVGARLFYVVQYWGVRIHKLGDVFKIWEGGIVLYGSIVGGTAAFVVYWYFRRFPLLPMLDAVAPAVALGIAIGRIGCFLNGCCYGDVCDSSLGVRFPPGSPPWLSQATARELPGVSQAVLKSVRAGTIPPGIPWSLPVQPTQLYSAFDGFILVALLSAYYPLRRRDGEVMALLMVTYPVTRFLIEYLRNDEGAIFAGLTISQNISILTLLGGLAFWAQLARRPAERYADRTQIAQSTLLAS